MVLTLQAKKEEMPAEEEKNKVPQPDRTEHDAKVLGSILASKKQSKFL